MKPFRAKQVAIEEPISDKSLLYWHQHFDPMQAAAVAFNAASKASQEVLARLIVEREGKDPKEGWRFDIDRLVLVKVPLPKE